MDGFSLKLLACILMLIDHIGAIFFPEILFIRVIGRSAFPIFAFLITEGYSRTKNLKKYIYRLLLLAVISEIPFMLAFDTTGLNIFFTLLAGIFVMIIWDKKYSIDSRFCDKKLLVNVSKGLIIIFKAVLILGIFYLVEKFNTDYSMYGICIILCFKIFKNNFINLTISMLILNILYTASLFHYLMTPYGTINFRVFSQATSIFSLFFLCKYNNTEGKKVQLLFYAFYPVHLIILNLIRGLLI
ncbi:TraX family protein [Clostridium sp.]|uniref:TraX family protein n=1 Tax=Clostridium sp. TaxID=1506 RepID=UPI003217A0F2